MFRMNFADAFTSLLAGNALTREAWPSTISIEVLNPTTGSEATTPYLLMFKRDANNPTNIVKFPVSLSPEALFATDWKVVV